MKLVGLVRLGRDAEMHYTEAKGTPFLSFSGAFNYGRKDDAGQRPTEWVDFTLFGDRAEKLIEYLLKGSQVFIVASDPHIEKFERRDGSSGSKLVAKIDDLEFAGSRASNEERPAQAPAAGRLSQTPTAAPARAPAPVSAPARPASGSAQKTSFDDMDDDIPF